MKNEELKKKIVDTMHPILKGTRVSCNEENACEHCLFPCEVDRIADRLADVLIAAGIGDVKEEKFESDHYWRMWQGSLVELERAEHRAERAKRALQYVCTSILKDRNDTERRVRAYFNAYLERAEKELSEEGKDVGKATGNQDRGHGLANGNEQEQYLQETKAGIE